MIRVLLLTLALFQQPLPPPPAFIPVPRKPAPIPKLTYPPVLYYGNVRVMPSKEEKAAIDHGTIVWKHVYRKLPPNRIAKNSLICWVYNFTHPISDGLGLHLKEGEAYDPRNVHLTTRYISFDVPAGDLVFWRVGGTQMP